MRLPLLAAALAVTVISAAFPAARRPAASLSPSQKPAEIRMSPEDARLAAQLLADFYRENLLETHLAYVKDGRPAAATVQRAVFQQMASKGWPRTRWLSVNGQPLNRDNLPGDAFEKEAAYQLRALGATLVERTEKGRYRAVATVPFTGPCLKCHWGDRPNQFQGGISFSIPLLPPTAREPREPPKER